MTCGRCARARYHIDTSSVTYDHHGHHISLARPAKSHQVQKIVSQIITGYARKNVEKYSNLISHSTVTSIDGSCDHRCNGKLCIADVFDKRSAKITDHEIMQGKTSEYSDESSTGPSNQMEIEGIEKVWKD